MAVSKATMRARLRGAVGNVQELAQSTATSREKLLAMSELARRYGGDHPPSAELAAHELRVFSQNGEDGVLAEIIRRSGAPGRSFVEFGAGTGAENNTAALADAFGWRGLLIEADPQSFARLERKYGSRPEIALERAAVTPENVEELFRRGGVPPEVDVMSIDVDGPDYWIWEAVRSWRPRFVIAEYNSGLGARRRLVQPREHLEGWDGTAYFGASIAALRALGDAKGYRLVHTEMTGNNAFFVRSDLPGEYPPAEAVRLHGPNLYLHAEAHAPDPRARAYVDLDSGQPSASS